MSLVHNIFQNTLASQVLPKVYKEWSPQASNAILKTTLMQPH
jgi:hypothetical protein